MIHTFDNPTGLNAVVYRMQKMLHELKKTWSDPNAEEADQVQFDVYPLLYIKTDKQKNRTMEHFTGGIDYESKNWAEQNKCWFIEPLPATDVAGTIDYKKTTLDIYFTADLSEVKKNITDHRADVEVRADVGAIIDKMYFVRNARNVTEIENVYKGFKHNIGDDMHPWHCFKISVDVYSFRNDQPECSI